MGFPNTLVTIVQLNYGVREIEKRKMMGFVMDDRKVEEKWKFCTRTLIS